MSVEKGPEKPIFDPEAEDPKNEAELTEKLQKDISDKVESEEKPTLEHIRTKIKREEETAESDAAWALNREERKYNELLRQEEGAKKNFAIDRNEILRRMRRLAQKVLDEDEQEVYFSHIEDNNTSK